MSVARLHYLVLCALLLACAFSARGATIHVSPDGDDSASGTRAAPIRSLAELQEVLRQRPEITEVVLGPGTYRDYFQILPPEANLQEIPPLTVRAADGAEVIVDGAVGIDNTTLPHGETKVYRAPVRPPRGEEGHFSFDVWEEDTWTRYQEVADIAAVRRFPAGVTFQSDSMLFHTSDGAPPADHRIRMMSPAMSKYGVLIRRPNVTLKGLTVRNFRKGCIGVAGKGSVALDCRVSNASIGIAMGGTACAARECLVENCGTGVYVNGRDMKVENCRILKPKSDFTMSRPVQEDTGIEVYSPAGGEIVIRGNVVKGFRDSGVLFKCKPGKFLVENNVFVENTTGIIIVKQTDCEAVVRNNIFYNCGQAASPTSFRGYEKRRAHHNCVWTFPWKTARPLTEQAEDFSDAAKSILLADPLFAAAERNDYRLSLQSPCLGSGSHDANIGLLEVAGETPDRTPPALNLARQPALAAANDPDGGTFFVTQSSSFALHVQAYDPGGEVVSIRTRFGDNPWSSVAPFKTDRSVPMPVGTRAGVLYVQVADAYGNWSEPKSLRIIRQEGTPELLGEVTVRENPQGAAIAFQTAFPCFASGRYGTSPGKLDKLLSTWETAGGETALLRRRHVFWAIRHKADGSSGPRFYRIELRTLAGKTHTLKGRFRFAGQPNIYHVATDGEDEESRGSRERPWRTIQYAVDRTLPGDRVVIAPGLYAERVLLSHGGAAEAPVTIVAAEKWRTVIDGHRRYRRLIELNNAPYVIFDGLQVRWIPATYSWAFHLKNSPYATVRNCRIWNSFWTTQRLDGVGIGADDSPHLRVERNLLHGLDFFMVLWRSPYATIRQNTMHRSTHGGIRLLYSVKGTSVRNNSLTYAGGVAYRLAVDDLKELRSFDADYNNLATYLRPAAWRDEPDAAPNMPVRRPSMGYHGGAKGIGALVLKEARGAWQMGEGSVPKWIPDETKEIEDHDVRLHTFEDWQRFSGKDRHSLFQDPKYHDLLSFDFRLSPDSPNIGAGENGTNIGAMERVDEPRQPVGK